MTQNRKWFSKSVILFLCLLTIAFVLRVIMLDTLPPALFRDEAEKAINGFSLAFSGCDVDNRFLPLFIRVFGVTTSAIYQYACVPFMWLLGPSEWGARLPAVTVAMLTIIFNYLFMARAVNRQTAMIASLFLAISPWHIIFSRWGQQGIFLPMFASLSMYGAVYWQQTSRLRGIILSAVCAALMLYAYDVARLFVPLMLLGSAIIWRKTILSHIKVFAIAVSCGILVTLPVAWLLLFNTDAAQARFSTISIFSQGAPFSSIIGTFLRNYWNHWSIDFLLLYGDAELRHGAGVGVLNPVEWFALPLAVVYFLLRHNKQSAFWLCWMLAWPVAASLTRIGVPHALRSIVALPGIQDIAAIGIGWGIASFPQKYRKGVIPVFVLITLTAFIRFATTYYSPVYRQLSAPNWQYGIKQSIEQLAPLFESDATTTNTQVIFYSFQGAEYLVPYYAHFVLSPQASAKLQSNMSIAQWSTPLPDGIGDDEEQTIILVQPFDIKHFPELQAYYYPIYAPFSNGNRKDLCVSIWSNKDLTHALAPAD